MIDVSKTIQAKSDQLNANDLLGGPRILKITNVKEGSSAEQPIIISYEGDNGRPWKPCLGMRCVLVAAWGKDGLGYIGRSVEVFCDPTVKWAGMEVGGVRITRMSDLKNTIVVALAISRGKKVPVTIRPLEVANKTSPPTWSQSQKDEAKALLDKLPPDVASKFRADNKGKPPSDVIDALKLLAQKD